MSQSVQYLVCRIRDTPDFCGNSFRIFGYLLQHLQHGVAGGRVECLLPIDTKDLVVAKSMNFRRKDMICLTGDVGDSC